MLNRTILSIRNWANDRGIIKGSDAKHQTLKLGEEYGELCSNILKGRLTEARDDIGDCIVLLTIISEQIGSNLAECAEISYNEIKDRKGILLDGVFIKEEDLYGEGWCDISDNTPILHNIVTLRLCRDGVWYELSKKIYSDEDLAYLKDFDGCYWIYNNDKTSFND